MQRKLEEEIKILVDSQFRGLEGVKKDYLARLSKGALTRDENEASHFCAFFLPFNLKTKKVLVGDHKKSGLWLFPGGHIDEGETIFETLNREIEEELGVKRFYSEKPQPFLFTKTEIVNDVRPCKTHFDVWYLMETDGSDFNIDPYEYHETRWVSVEEARDLNNEAAVRQALNYISKFSSAQKK